MNNKRFYIISFIFLVWFPKKSFADVHNEACFTITTIKIQSLDLIPKRELDNIKSRYENQCLTQSKINQLLRDLLNKYIESGYITVRPFVPDQNLRNGVLDIVIKEGYIDNIEYTSKKRIKQDHVLPISKNKIFNLRDLEQTIDQFSRLKSNNTKVQILPGKNPGTSTIKIDDKKKKFWNLETGIDNSGTKSKGIRQSFTNITFDDLLRSNDQISIGHRRSLGNLKDRYSKVTFGGITIPYRYMNLNFNTTYSDYRTYIYGNREKFKNRGTSRSLGFNVDGVLHRDGVSKTIASVGYNHDNYKNYIADTRIEVASYKIDKVNIVLNHQRRFKKSVLGIGASYTLGLNNSYVKQFGHFKTPNKKFQKLGYDLFWLRPIKMKPEYFKPKLTSILHGQYSPNRLVGAEKITIGGLSSVRGFKEMVESADNGIYMRNEFALGLFMPKSLQNTELFEDMEIFAGLDAGIFNNAEEKKDVYGNMSGAAFGIRNIKGLVKFDFTISKAITSKYIKPKNMEYYFSISLAL